MEFFRGAHCTDRRLQQVLTVFLGYPGQRLYGLDIADMAGLGVGSIYPELLRLERDGWLHSGWDDRSNPRRRLYWLNQDAPSRERL
jgi:hypothetical protein